jgi:protein-S-isoprenylcysteine O-methyltransferase Ste14
VADWLFSNVPDNAKLPIALGLTGLVLWVLEVGWLFVRSVPHRRNLREDRGSFWLVASAWTAASMCSVFDALSWRITTFPNDLTRLQFLGVPLLAVGCTLRILGRLALGEDCKPFVQTSASQTLVTTGIYGALRHPAYVGALSELTGISLCFGSIIGIGAALAGGIPAVAYRIHVEERALRARFGLLYEEYAARTHRVLPGFR